MCVLSGRGTKMSREANRVRSFTRLRCRYLSAKETAGRERPKPS